jgi:hypothetical protein
MLFKVTKDMVMIARLHSNHWKRALISKFDPIPHILPWKDCLDAVPGIFLQFRIPALE